MVDADAQCDLIQKSTAISRDLEDASIFSISVVYSSGVLHHTPNTQETLMEVYRVLRPGGEAIIGLYATFSIMFLWYRLHAILRGNVTRKAIGSWVNSNTPSSRKLSSPLQ